MAREPLEAVRTRSDFLCAYRSGKRRTGTGFVLYARPNGLDRSRLGITTTRKLGGAVARNRARRRIREAVRQQAHPIRRGWDLVIVARPAVLNVRFDRLTGEIFQRLEELGALEKEA